MQPKVTSTDLGEVLSGILAGVDAEAESVRAQLEKEPSVIAASTAARAGDTWAFRQALSEPVDTLIDGILHHQLPHNHEVRFLVKQSKFVEMQLRGRIEAAEGMTCAADKTRFLMEGLFAFFTQGRELVFDRTQKYTFHLPKSVLCTHAEVLEFFLAVRELYYGDPKRFIAALQPKPPCAACDVGLADLNEMDAKHPGWEQGACTECGRAFAQETT